MARTTRRRAPRGRRLPAMVASPWALVAAAALLAGCGSAKADRSAPPAARAHRASASASQRLSAKTADSTTTARAPATTAPATTTAALAPATTVAQSVGYGYLAAGQSEVVFLQFTKAPGGEVTGSMYDDSLSASPPNETVQSNTDSFTGTLAGSELTLNFNSASAPVFGRLNSTTVRLELPQSDGSLAEVSFIKATPAQYDTALQRLQQTASSANQSVIAPVNPSTACVQNCPKLPAVPSGYYSVGVFSPSNPSDLVNFSNLPLQVCFAVSGSINSLTYEIGSPSGGPTTLYQGGSQTGGCVSDPGNDSGLTNVTITAGGSGMWLVQIDQATETQASVLQQQAQQRQQEQAQQQQAQQVIDDAAQSVTGDESTLAGDTSTLSGDEQTLASDVSLVKQDLQTVRSDLGQVQSDMRSDRTEACGDAGTVAGDEGSLEGDQGSYQGDMSSQETDVSTVQQDAATLSSDWGALVSAEAAEPSYVPSGGLPSHAAELAALGAAKAALTKYHQSAKQDTQTIAGYVSTAKGYVAQANKLCSESTG